MLDLLADHSDQLALVLHEFARILRDHDVLAMRDERVVGAIADIGVGRQLGLLAALFRHLGHVLGVIEPGRVEGFGDHRHEEFARATLAPRRGLLVAGELVALDLDDFVALDDAVGFAPIRLVSEPAHRFPSLSRGFSAIIAQPPKAATGASSCRRSTATGSAFITRRMAPDRPSYCRTAMARPVACGTGKSRPSPTATG